jgi:hypothetical protein
MNTIHELGFKGFVARVYPKQTNKLASVKKAIAI